MTGVTTHRTLFSVHETHHYDYIDDWTSSHWRPWVRIATWLTGIVAVIALIASLIVGCYTIDRQECQARANGLHLTEQWSWRVGCQVRLADGRVVSIESLRFNEQGSLAP